MKTEIIFCHVALGREIHDEFRVVYVDTTDLYLEKKLHCANFPQC